MQFSIKKHQASNRRDVNHFYKRQKQNVNCHNLDAVYIAVNEMNGEIIAAAFIRFLESEEQSVSLLRSVYVNQEYRQLGVGQNLCRFALSDYVDTVYTLCEPQLINFYRGLGFEPTERTPTHQQIDNAIKKGLTLLVRPSHC